MGCWRQISQKIQDSKYENAEQFVEDAMPLVELMLSDKDSVLRDLRDLLDPQRALSQISVLKSQMNGSQLLSNILSKETVPNTIMQLFHRGQLAGIHSSRATPKVLQNPPVASPSSSSQKTVFKRETQPPPFSCCHRLPHENYYGVWLNLLSGAFVAQVSLA